MLCKICGSEMELWKNKKWICTNENCDNIIVINNKKWYIDLSDDISLWNINVMNNAPSIIAYGYFHTREMLKSAAVEGVVIQVKDVFESILKFSVLTVLSDFFAKNNNSALYNAVLYDLTFKLPSLGDWEKAAVRLANEKKFLFEPIMAILSDIVCIYKKYDITAWRNSTIGHGAFSSTENLDFRNDLIQKLRIIATHFEKNETYYTELKLLLKYGKKYIELCGSDMARNLIYSDRELYIGYCGKKMPLMPLIRNIDKGIYFFDSYIARKRMTAYINYVHNVGISPKKEIDDKIIRRLYKKMVIVNNLTIADTSVEDKIYTRAEAESVEKILEPDTLAPFTFLRDTINGFISGAPKGFFLLEMENGMGKTTFTRTVDTLAYRTVKHSLKDSTKKKMRFDDSVLCRAFYINHVYSYSALSFVNGLSDALRRADNDEELVGDIPTVDVYAKDADKQTAVLINTLFEAQKSKFAKKKMLLIIDGVDEYGSSQGNNLLKLLPQKEDIHEGVYFLLTSRTQEQISEYTRKLLENISFDNILSIKSDSKDYHSLMEGYVRDKTGEDGAVAEKLIAFADRRMLNLPLAVDAYLQIGGDFIQNTPFHILDAQRALYGDFYFNEIIQLAAIISAVPIPISVYHLAGLSRENRVTFKLLAYIGSLKPILNVAHISSGTFMSITRPEIREYLTDNAEMFDCLFTVWMEDLLIHSQKQNMVDFSLVEKEILLLEFVSICAASENCVKRFFEKKYIAEMAENIEFLLSSVMERNNEWDMLLQGKLLELLCKKIIPLVSSIKNQQIQSFITELIIIIAERIQPFDIDIRGTIEMLLPLVKFIDDHDLDIEAKFDLCSLLGGMYGKINDDTMSQKYFTISNELSTLIVNENNLHNKTAPTKDVHFNNMRLQFLSNNEIRQAIILKSERRDSEAEEHLQKAEKYLNAMNAHYRSSLEVHLWQTFGNLYKRTNPTKALEYFSKIRESLVFTDGEDSGAMLTLSNLCLNMGQTYRILKKYDKALEQYNQGTMIMEQMKISGKSIDIGQLASLYHSTANVYRDIKNFDTALQFYRKALDLLDEEIKLGHSINTAMYAEIKTCIDKVINVLLKFEQDAPEIRMIGMKFINTLIPALRMQKQMWQILPKPGKFSLDQFMATFDVFYAALINNVRRLCELGHVEDPITRIRLLLFVVLTDSINNGERYSDSLLNFARQALPEEWIIYEMTIIKDEYTPQETMDKVSFLKELTDEELVDINGKKVTFEDGMIIVDGVITAVTEGVDLNGEFILRVADDGVYACHDIVPKARTDIMAFCTAGDDITVSNLNNIWEKMKHKEVCLIPFKTDTVSNAAIVIDGIEVGHFLCSEDDTDNTIINEFYGGKRINGKSVQNGIGGTPIAWLPVTYEYNKMGDRKIAVVVLKRIHTLE